MTDRDPFRSHRRGDDSIPPRKVVGVEIREKRVDDAAPTSISPSGLLGWGARHGRTWSPLGVAIMFALIWASVIGGGLYALNSDAGKALIAAWKANTEELAALRRERAEDRALLEKIDKQLKVSGAADSTTRIVDLERKMGVVGIALSELNGARLNDTFPVAEKGDFTPPPEAPRPVFPMLTTKQQWATKPE